jgi:hypothetical protein
MYRNHMLFVLKLTWSVQVHSRVFENLGSGSVHGVDEKGGPGQWFYFENGILC